MTAFELLDAALSDTPANEDIGYLLPRHVFEVTMPSTDTPALYYAVDTA